MVYLTHYTEYPIYEPAEGGYYYAGCEADNYYRLNSIKQAQRKLLKLYKNLNNEGFILGENKLWRNSKYIGEGEFWIIEKVYGAHRSGRQVY